MKINKKNEISFKPEEFAYSLCLELIESIKNSFKKDPTELSQNLCAMLGETLKVVVSCSGQLHYLNNTIKSLSSEIQPREKLILDCMLKYRESSSEFIKLLSYQSDVNTCAAVVHNVSVCQQLAGLFNESYLNIGCFLDRFEIEDSEALDKLQRGGNYFFGYHNIYRDIRGFHNFFDRIPEICKTSTSAGPIRTIPSDRIRYYFGLYGSDETLGESLEIDTEYFQTHLIIEYLRRSLDTSFLKPIIEKYFEKNNIKSFSFSMLTHLPWGGEQLALFRPLLIKERDISDNLDNSTYLCNAMELAAHVGEKDLARKINRAAFNYSYDHDFELDNVDYFFQACIAADLIEEADEWLLNGEADEWDLPGALYNATDYLCSRGWTLEDAYQQTYVERIDHQLIGSKWANGFDVVEDIEFLFNNNLCQGFDKIMILKYLGNLKGASNKNVSAN